MSTLMRVFMDGKRTEPYLPRLAMPAGQSRTAVILMIAGAIGVVAGIFAAPETVAAHLLLLGFLGVCLGLAGALILALECVTGARWSVRLHGVPEAMVTILPVGSVILLVALFAFPSLYPWTNPDEHLHGDFKQFWLQRPSFLVRAVAFLLGWNAVAWLLVLVSRAQDAEGSTRYSFAQRSRSALFLVVFASTFWLACHDWLMSREPEWVSTMFGLYNFAGLFTGGWAVYILLVLWLQRLGPFRRLATQAQLHDLGKLLFAMCIFWAYLWYFQYMLIWFVNNPEETPYYIRRLEGVWASLFYLNVALNAGIPFLVLLPRATKHDPKILVIVCIVVLLGRWLDLYLMVLPVNGGWLAMGIALAMTFGALGLYLFVICQVLNWDFARTFDRVAVPQLGRSFR